MCSSDLDFSAETLQTRREQQDIFKVMKGENLQPRLLYPARISFTFEGEIKTFTDKQKSREFSTNTPALQEVIYYLYCMSGFTGKNFPFIVLYF